MSNGEKKTLIGALASHDSDLKNRSLAEVLKIAMSDAFFGQMEKFAFVFTGGTFDRLFKGTDRKKPLLTQIDDSGTTEERLKKCGVVRLPEVKLGGVTIMAHLVTQRKITIVWPFYTSWTSHILNPENLALLRLCDQWHAKKLMNVGSVVEWMKGEAVLDFRRNPQDVSLPFQLISGTVTSDRAEGAWCFGDPKPGETPDLYDVDPETELLQVHRMLSTMRLALISHDEKKDRMVEFVTDYQQELARFQKVLATGTTGRLVMEAAPSLPQGIVHQYNSGPKGGDIEIATEILYGNCHVVIFFVDPLHPHPHAEDIRVVFRACMTNEEVRMLSTEQQAREWMDRAVRRMLPR